MQPFEVCVTEVSICFHSGWHYRCSVTLVTQQAMRSSHDTPPLLRNARHRATITPGSPVRIRLIHTSSSYWTIYRSFEIILEWRPSTGLEFKCSMQIHCFKNHSIWYKLKFKKYLIAEGSSGSDGWARVKRERTYSWEPMLRKILFDLRHLQSEHGGSTWNENIWTPTRPNEKIPS